MDFMLKDLSMAISTISTISFLTACIGYVGNQMSDLPRTIPSTHLFYHISLLYTSASQKPGLPGLNPCSFYGEVLDIF